MIALSHMRMTLLSLLLPLLLGCGEAVDPDVFFEETHPLVLAVIEDLFADPPSAPGTPLPEGVVATDAGRTAYDDVRRELAEVRGGFGEGRGADERHEPSDGWGPSLIRLHLMYERGPGFGLILEMVRSDGGWAIADAWHEDWRDPETGEVR